jgi:hypothetical protein
VTKNLIREGEVLVILMAEKKVPERHSGLCPSNKKYQNGIPAHSITKKNPGYHHS